MPGSGEGTEHRYEKDRVAIDKSNSFTLPLYKLHKVPECFFYFLSENLRARNRTEERSIGLK